MNEGVEKIPDVSPPRLQPEMPPMVFSEGRNVGTLDCSPTSANITEKSTAEYWGAFAAMTIFSSTWSQLHLVFFFLRREILHGPLCKR